MEDRNPQPQKSKRQYRTLISLLSSMIFKLILLSLLSWFLLIAWFGIKEVFTSGSRAQDTIQSIIDANLTIMFYCQFKSFNYLSEIITIISSITRWINGYMNITFISIIFGSLLIVISRFYIFMASLPLFFLFIFVGIIDGLVKRDIRKFEVARESSFVFHRVNPLLGMFCASLFLIYMSLPFASTPHYFLITIAVVCSFFIMLTIRNFKKYV